MGVFYGEKPDFTVVVAEGGDVSQIELDGKFYQIHTFLSDGNLNVLKGGQVDVLVVGGGGGGGADGGNDGAGGGAGAGGVIFDTFNVSAHSYSITVGNGGIGSTSRSDIGTNGESSIAFNLEAIGGGRGGTFDSSIQYAEDGGSGGGTFGRNLSSNGGGGAGLQPTSEWGGFGNSGGARTGTSSSSGGAGGGGAGSAGNPSTTSNNGQNGGIGMDFSHIFGIDVGDDGWFAGGGGGGRSGSSNDPGEGGKGGGGDSEEAGQAGTGGGGGGGHNGTMLGRDGGSGIVVVRYQITKGAYLKILNQ